MNENNQNYLRYLYGKLMHLYDNWMSEAEELPIKEAIINKYYLRMVGMGPNIVPMILGHIDETPCRMCEVLQYIICENPVKEENEGDFVKMSKDWTEYAENIGMPMLKPQEKSLIDTSVSLDDIKNAEDSKIIS